jgi:hypothetical protein
MADFNKTVTRVNPDGFHTGDVPSSVQGYKLYGANNYLRNWIQNGMIARYSGRPDSAINGNPTGSANTLYIFSRYPERPDLSDQRVGISTSFWAKDFGGVTELTARTLSWYNDVFDGSPSNTDSGVLGSIVNDHLSGLSLRRSGTDNQFYGDVTPQDNSFSDGDMEDAGTSAYSAINSATLSKQTTNPYAGTQVLRVARNGVNNPGARDGSTNLGDTFRVRVKARSDGNAVPRILHNGVVLWAGTTSTEWQNAVVSFVSTSTAAGVDLRAQTSTGTEYCEFDNAELRQYEGFKLSKLTITYCYLAALSLYTLPADVITDQNMYFVRPKNFVTYESLRGATSVDPNTSVGRLWWNLEQGESVVQNSSKCLFQTPYPTGGYVGSAGSLAPFQADSAGNALKYRVRPRGLTGTTTVQTDIACVVNTMAAGDKIQFASSTAGDTWTYTASSAIATPRVITTAHGVGVAGSGLAVNSLLDDVTVKAQGADVHVNTISLWESERIQ